MKEFFVSDIHFPFEHKSGWELFLTVVKAEKPDLIFLGGDIADCYTVSSYPRNRKTEYQDELNYTYGELVRLRHFAGDDCRIIYLQGNHELRHEKNLNSKAPELKDLESLQFPALLKLNSLNIEWLPNGTRWKHHKLYHLHGNEIGGGSGYTAKAVFSKITENAILGHHHRSHSYKHYCYDEETRGVYLNGCLCSFDVEYCHHPQWNLGFSVINYVGDFFDVKAADIYLTRAKASCIVNGTLYEVARD